MTAAARIPTLAEHDDSHVCEGERCGYALQDCEQADDGVWLCRECADREHAEQERAEELAYGPGALNEQEGW